MNSVNHDKALAQKAMDKLLVDLLSREQLFEAVQVTQITRLPGERPCWYLWTEDNQGVYQLELQDVGQVHCGRKTVGKPFQEMEADFVLQYLPFSDTGTVAAGSHQFSAQKVVATLPRVRSVINNITPGAPV